MQQWIANSEAVLFLWFVRVVTSWWMVVPKLNRFLTEFWKNIWNVGILLQCISSVWKANLPYTDSDYSILTILAFCFLQALYFSFSSFCLLPLTWNPPPHVIVHPYPPAAFPAPLYILLLFSFWFLPSSLASQFPLLPSMSVSNPFSTHPPPVPFLTFPSMHPFPVSVPIFVAPPTP